MKSVIKSIIAFFVGTLIFIGIVNFLQFPTLHNSVKKEMSQTIEKKSLNFSNPSKEDTLKEIGYKKEIKNKITSKKSEIAFFRYISSNSKVIVMIYLLIYLAFISQIIALSLDGELLYENRNLYYMLSEWSINAPTVLGVIGTLYSFGVLVGNMSDVSTIDTLFKSSFTNAAQTTILGGITYVTNLFVSVLVTKKIEKEAFYD